MAPTLQVRLQDPHLRNQRANLQRDFLLMALLVVLTLAAIVRHFIMPALRTYHAYSKFSLIVANNPPITWLS